MKEDLRKLSPSPANKLVEWRDSKIEKIIKTDQDTHVTKEPKLRSKQQG